ncbi:MAG: Crp/Fnr family transcriptional regulator, partial [Anaerolineales bacterium]|nr:Crp/Fnr family transcriptional regulator [Anaerolineales bacterium]
IKFDGTLVCCDKCPWAGDFYHSIEDICHYKNSPAMVTFYIPHQEELIMPGDYYEQLPFFADFTPEQMALIQQIFIPCDCYADTVLFDQGDPAEHLFLIIVGEVAVRYRPDDGAEIPVARITAGGIVGWSAALGNPRYTSAAVCTGYTQMLRVSGRDLRSLYNDNADTGILILERLAEVIADRLDETHDHVVDLLKQGFLNGSLRVKEI